MTLFPILLTAALLAPAGDDDAAVVAKQLPSYPLHACPMSGEALGSMGDAIDVVVDGRLVRLCCGGCEKKLRADPGAAFAKIDAGVKAQQTASYPLDTCVVSGEPLGDEPVDMVHGTRLVRFCCNGCRGDFAEAPGRFMTKIDMALMKAQAASYPLDACVVSGEPLGDHPVDVLHGTTLVRFCCKGCKKDFAADPQAFLEKIAAARERASSGDAEES